MQTFDIKKVYKSQYSASQSKIKHLNVENMTFIMIDGIGNPKTEEFKQKSKVLKLFSKEVKAILKEQGITYTIPPLEGMWDTYDNTHFDVSRKDSLIFTLMMSFPTMLDSNLFSKCLIRVKDKIDDVLANQVYQKDRDEGQCLQMLHKGAYNTEIDTTKKIMEYITVENMKLSGYHHEIYLNDPARVEPEDLKTIVRYAIEDA